MKVFIVLKETSRFDIIQHVTIEGVYSTHFNALQKVEELKQLYWEKQDDPANADIREIAFVETRNVE